MNQPPSLRSDKVAGIPWNGWPACSGIAGRNRLDCVADFTGMRSMGAGGGGIGQGNP